MYLEQILLRDVTMYSFTQQLSVVGQLPASHCPRHRECGRDPGREVPLSSMRPSGGRADSRHVSV